MKLSRRGFLGAILTAGVAPAIVKAASLMPVRPVGALILPGDEDFNLTGGRFVYSLPDGLRQVYVEMYGAGGGGSGGMEYVSRPLTLEAGRTYTVVVGQ